MKKLNLGIMMCCLSMVAACGDSLSGKEDEAVAAGKTTVSYQREDKNKSRLDYTFEKVLVILADDSYVKEMLDLGHITSDRNDDSEEVQIRNLNGNKDSQTFFVDNVAANAKTLLEHAEIGHVVMKSEPYADVVEMQEKLGQLLFLPGGQRLKSSEIRKGVEIEITQEKGEVKFDIKR